MIRFFELLTIPTPKTSDTNTTQELLSLVTGLAQNLKSLIRIGLSAALYLVRKRFTSKFILFIFFVCVFVCLSIKKIKLIIYYLFIYYFCINHVPTLTFKNLRNENLELEIQYLIF